MALPKSLPINVDSGWRARLLEDKPRETLVLFLALSAEPPFSSLHIVAEAPLNDPVAVSRLHLRLPFWSAFCAILNAQDSADNGSTCDELIEAIHGFTDRFMGFIPVPSLDGFQFSGAIVESELDVTYLFARGGDEVMVWAQDAELSVEQSENLAERFLSDELPGLLALSHPAAPSQDQGEQ